MVFEKPFCSLPVPILGHQTFWQYRCCLVHDWVLLNHRLLFRFGQTKTKLLCCLSKGISITVLLLWHPWFGAFLKHGFHLRDRKPLLQFRKILRIFIKRESHHWRILFVYSFLPNLRSFFNFRRCMYFRTLLQIRYLPLHHWIYFAYIIFY